MRNSAINLRNHMNEICPRQRGNNRLNAWRVGKIGDSCQRRLLSSPTVARRWPAHRSAEEQRALAAARRRGALRALPRRLEAQHATCNMQYATCDMQHATCNMRHATCDMQRTPRSRSGRRGARAARTGSAARSIFVTNLHSNLCLASHT